MKVGLWAVIGIPLTAAFAKENYKVISTPERDKSLESYDVSLVGGGKNA